MARTPNDLIPVSSHRSTWSSLVLKCCLGIWLFAVLASYTSSAPINSPAVSSTEKPRWKNPCGIPGHLFNADEDLKGAPEISTTQLYSEIIITASNANRSGVAKKDEFVREAFPDEGDFESGVETEEESWLPKIPNITDNLQREEAFRSTYEILQYFAVGLEQTVLDQLDTKKFLRLFRAAENDLISILCELQRGMTILRVKANPDVEREIMKQQRRTIVAESHRNVRDYLILRDYIKAIRYVVNVFSYLKSKNL